MRIVKVEFEGKTLRLTHQEKKWQLLFVKGTNPPSSQLNKSNVVGGHGSIFNGSRINDRQIVLTLKINGDVEKNKLELYEYLSPDSYIKLYYQTERLNVYINGHVTINECDTDSMSVLMQVTIDCLEPFFNDVVEVNNTTTSLESLFEFVSDGTENVGYFQIDQSYENGEYDGGMDFTMISLKDKTYIQNRGQTDVGTIIRIDCLSDVVNPKITHLESPTEYFGLNYSFAKNDSIIINTNFSKEEVYLIRNNERINLLNYLMLGVTWLQLPKGTSTMFHNANSGNEFMVVNYSFTPQYKGV